MSMSERELERGKEHVCAHRKERGRVGVRAQMMLLMEGDGAGFGFPSCATRFSPLRSDLCVLSVWHVSFSERHRTTKGREEGGTGRGYHVCAITKDKEQTELEKRGNKTQGRSCRHRPFIGQNRQQRQKR